MTDRLRALRRSVVAVAASFSLTACAAAADRIVLEQAETMGISLFRAHWDTPIPLAEDGARNAWGNATAALHRGAYADWSEAGRAGRPGALACDALNRSLLVRFPEAAERIAAELRGGRSIAKVELILPFLDEELFPPGRPDWPGPDSYSFRANWGVQELYAQNRPRWHVIASALRKAWSADAERGPTLFAASRGVQPWREFGARNEQEDRHPTVFGPAEVSYVVGPGRLDVTAALLDPAFGKSLAQRLRQFADCGLIVRKWETYDHRYYRGPYEWATATGGRAILFRAPRLEVTFAPQRGERAEPLPPRAKPATPSAQNAAAALPSPAEIARFAAAAELRPAWADDPAWQRLQELFALETGVQRGMPRWCQFLPPHLVKAALASLPKAASGQPDPTAVAAATYAVWIDKLIGRQTRGWDGFEAANDFTEWQLAREILPAPAVEAIRRYWVDWLLPDRPTCPPEQFLNPNWADGSLIHPMADQLAARRAGTPWTPEAEDQYWRLTGDWRGNKSFFRSGFLRTESTQNFNTTSSIGAAVFGGVIGSPVAIADGREGIERWLVNHWIWNHGSSQEHLDHYYFGVTLKGLKTLVNGAPDARTRLVADGLLMKAMEETIGAWHPHLRRFIAPSTRTSLEYLLGSQDGLSYILHSLSRKGALTDLDRALLPGNIPVLATETTPGLAARLALPSPWAAPELAELVDEKPLPWEATSLYQKTWRRTWLGEHFGMGSSTTDGIRIQAMAQWRREDRETRSALDLGTLEMRFGMNDTRWVNEAPGWLGSPGHQVVAQAGAHWLALAVPKVVAQGLAGYDPAKIEVRSLQHSIGLFDLRPSGPTWELWVNGKRIESLPAIARPGDAIVLRDGVTYLGIIALPLAGDGGAGGEVRLEAGKPQSAVPGAHPPLTITPALVIHSYLIRGETPLPPETDWLALGQRATGFAVTMSDAKAEPDFATFRARCEASRVSSQYDRTSRQLTARYETESGAFVVTAQQIPEPTGLQLTTATWNDYPIYPAADVLRDTPTSAFGWNAVAKGGARFSAIAPAAPIRLFLQTTSRHDRFIAWNPQGQRAVLSLTLPSGAQIETTGPVGVCRLEVDATGQRVRLDYTPEPGDAPVALRTTGFPVRPEISINGRVEASADPAAATQR